MLLSVQVFVYGTNSSVVSNTIGTEDGRILLWRKNHRLKHKALSVFYQNVFCDVIKVSKACKLLFDSNQGDLQRCEVDSLPTGNLPATIRRISYWCLLIGQDGNMATVSNISNDWQIDLRNLKENLSTIEVNLDFAKYNQILFRYYSFETNKNVMMFGRSKK